MNHRPFEDWLLEDQRLTSDEERELQAHLRVCTSCAAIAEFESGTAFHTDGLTDGRFRVPLRDAPS